MATAFDPVARADWLRQTYGTRDPAALCAALRIHVMPRPFSKQKGVYKIIKGSRFVFLNQDLPEGMEKIVLLHELGHDQLHRDEAKRFGGFKEFNLFDVQGSRMEYEANVFAAQLALEDEEILDCAYSGYDIAQTASILQSDPNLVMLKVEILAKQGHEFRTFEPDRRFLK